jgi:hypothetical protein
MTYKVEHIVWRNTDIYDQNITGLLEVEICYHGNDDYEKIIVEGTFYNGYSGGIDTPTIKTSFGLINKNTTGVAYVRLLRVGTFVDR